MSDEDLLYAMLYFCEENWDAFLQRCIESGFHEVEVEEAVDNARRE